jgi:hypothetical protein
MTVTAVPTLLYLPCMCAGTRLILPQHVTYLVGVSSIKGAALFADAALHPGAFWAGMLLAARLSSSCRVAAWWQWHQGKPHKGLNTWLQEAMLHLLHHQRT